VTETAPRRIEVDGRTYRVDVLRRTVEAPQAPRLVLVGHHVSEQAAAMTRAAVRSMIRHAGTPHEVWVVDNNSPDEFSAWLREEPQVNVIFNHTEPLLREGVSPRGLLSRLFRPASQASNRSYANGLALQLAAQVIEPESAIFGVFHNDVLACKPGWLRFLLSKMDDTARGASVATHNSPAQITSMSASGYLIDFQLVQQWEAHFLPNQPLWDAAELPCHRLVEAGYTYYASQNTFNQPESVEQIPLDHPLRAIHADRSFDDDGEVYFMHLGRGTEKAAGRYDKPDRTYPEQWLAYAEEHVLA
jgi:hypothetical protein